MSKKLAGPHTYRLPLLGRLLAGVVGGISSFVVFALIAIIIDSWFPAAMQTAQLCAILVGISQFITWSRFQLIIKPTGITYIAPHYRIDADWADIAGNGWVSGWQYPVQGLILREPAPGVSYGRRFFLFSATQIPIEQSIPLGMFTLLPWRITGLARTIRRYAPHLFPNVQNNR